MPKEVLYGSQLPYSKNDPARSVVEVHWGRETGHVQIATRCIRADDHMPFIPDEWKDALRVDRPVPNVIFAQEGFFIDLDRKGINDLIRFLRKARDQAFGKDE